MRTKLFILLTMLAFSYVESYSQLKINSVAFDGVYSSGLTKKNNLKMEKSTGYGGELNLKFDVAGNLKMTVGAGYQYFSIDQEIHALFKEWNWRGWKRYFGDINDTNKANFYNKYVQILLRDTANYRGTFTPVQNMQVFPIMLAFNYDLEMSKDFTISPFLGGGVIFYTRELYVEESWEKFFPNQNHYVFSYSYRNFAPKIYGNPFAAMVGLTAEYALNDYVKVSMGAKYFQVINTGKTFNYNEFPTKDMFTAKLGISFLY